MINFLLPAVSLFGAYLIGSIPTGFIIARLYGIADIRHHGSGTIGATNVARIVGKKFFALVLVIDAGKSYGWLAFLSMVGLSGEVFCFAALALLLGNSASLFLRFTGGKGVATTVGALLFLAPEVVLVALIVWILVLSFTRTVGIASVVAAFSIIIIAFGMLYQQNNPVALTSIVMAVWVILLHKKM